MIPGAITEFEQKGIPYSNVRSLSLISLINSEQYFKTEVSNSETEKGHYISGEEAQGTNVK